MGATLTSFNVRTPGLTPEASAIVAGRERGAYVSPPGNGWVTVLDAEAESQDLAAVLGLGEALSAAAVAPVVALLLADSDLLVCFAFEGGATVAGYASVGTLGPLPGQRHPREDVKLEPWLRQVSTADAAAADDIDRILKRPANERYDTEDTRLTDLARALGVPDHRVVLHTRDFERGVPAPFLACLDQLPPWMADRFRAQASFKRAVAGDGGAPE